MATRSVASLCVAPNIDRESSFWRASTASEWSGKLVYQGHWVKVKVTRATSVRGWSAFASKPVLLFIYRSMILALVTRLLVALDLFKC